MTPIELPIDDEKYPFPFLIARLTYDLPLAQELLGEPHEQFFVDGLGDSDNWAFSYPCGLKLCFQLIHPIGDGLEGIANIFGDLPEFEHGVRHYPFPGSHVVASDLEVNARDIEALSKLPRFETPLASLHTRQVWRQGDDGNEMPVGKPTSERAAECWVAELQSHGHKQLYWSAPS